MIDLPGDGLRRGAAKMGARGRMDNDKASPRTKAAIAKDIRDAEARLEKADARRKALGGDYSYNGAAMEECRAAKSKLGDLQMELEDAEFQNDAEDSAGQEEMELCKCGHIAGRHVMGAGQCVSDDKCKCAKFKGTGRRNASPVQAMTLVFESDLDGRVSIPVDSAQEASRRYREYVEKNDLGASDISFGAVMMGGEKVAEIYFNGRVVLENDDDSSLLESMTMEQLLARHKKMKCAGKGVFFCGCATAMEYQSRMQDAGMGAPR